LEKENRIFATENTEKYGVKNISEKLNFIFFTLVLFSVFSVAKNYETD